jgi:hypothetical protein
LSSDHGQPNLHAVALYVCGVLQQHEGAESPRLDVRSICDLEISVEIYVSQLRYLNTNKMGVRNFNKLQYI